MRSKLKLDLDQLSVDSFDTTETEKQKGTVFGEQCTCWTQCGQNTCPGCPTCDASCNTCGASCYGTCGASCGATCGYTCDGWCTVNDYTCAPYGTCGARICLEVP
jgi:hypothetical protein